MRDVGAHLRQTGLQIKSCTWDLTGQPAGQCLWSAQANCVFCHSVCHDVSARGCCYIVLTFNTKPRLLYVQFISSSLWRLVGLHCMPLLKPAGLILLPAGLNLLPTGPILLPAGPILLPVGPILLLASLILLSAGPILLPVLFYCVRVRFYCLALWFYCLLYLFYCLWVRLTACCSDLLPPGSGMLNLFAVLRKPFWCVGKQRVLRLAWQLCQICHCREAPVWIGYHICLSGLSPWTRDGDDVSMMLLLVANYMAVLILFLPNI